jgi:hypothetical protein
MPISHHGDTATVPQADAAANARIPAEGFVVIIVDDANTIRHRSAQRSCQSLNGRSTGLRSSDLDQQTHVAILIETGDGVVMPDRDLGRKFSFQPFGIFLLSDNKRFWPAGLQPSLQDMAPDFFAMLLRMLAVD